MAAAQWSHGQPPPMSGGSPITIKKKPQLFDPKSNKLIDLASKVGLTLRTTPLCIYRIYLAPILALMTMTKLLELIISSSTFPLSRCLLQAATTQCRCDECGGEWHGRLRQ